MKSLLGALVLCLAATACGSNVDPATVAALNGTAGGGQVAGDGAVADGTDPSGEVLGDSSGGGPTSSDAGGGPTGSESGGGPTGSESGGGATGGGEAAAGNSKAGSCSGFDKDQPGVFEDKIVVANSSDISGPVPGLFESAQQATRAYLAFFNSTSDICGHKLEMLALDSRSDGGADQQAYVKACSEAFAAVGSMSAFDAGGAASAQSCGLPDIRSTTVTPERNKCTTCFATQAVSPNLVPTSVPKYWLGKNREATQNVALLYVNVGASATNSSSFRKAWETAGWKIPYFQGIDVSEFNYTPYVQQMKDKKIQFVVYVGPYQFTTRLQEAMRQQSFKPDVFMQDSTIYDSRYVEQAGPAGEGSYVYSTTALFDDYSIPEMKLYRTWLQQVAPGAIPNYFGLYAWSAARLFAEKANELGGKLTRPAMVNALKGVKNWTGNGIHAPQQVGAETTANCTSIFQLNSGKWSKVSPGNYQCGPLTNTGIGG